MSHTAALATIASLSLPLPSSAADTAGVDSEMIQAARLLWPGPQQIEPVAGGLFNRVLRVTSPAGTHYLKRFTETALSGDFPPLPTRAAQRCLVACSWHDLASRACAMLPASRQLSVPALVAIQSEYDVIAMDAAAGTPLYDQLHAAAQGGVGEESAIELPLRSIARWLGRLHALPLQPRDALLAASRPFKAFKVELQYVRLVDGLPSHLHRAALAFIHDYLTLEAEPVHGDLNSRNVLIDTGREGAGAAGASAASVAIAVSVIDFEQGHFGEGSYDLAYLLSEYAIRALQQDRDPFPLVARTWDHYGSTRLLPDPSAWQRRLHLHLAFQCLYRLLGPTRAVWTGHLDEAAGRRVREWSLGILERLL